MGRIGASHTDEEFRDGKWRTTWVDPLSKDDIKDRVEECKKDPNSLFHTLELIIE